MHSSLLSHCPHSIELPHFKYYHHHIAFNLSHFPFIGAQLMEDGKKWRQVPAFGSWNFYDEAPIAKYFESVRETGLIQAHFFGGDGKVLFEVVSQQHQRKRKEDGGRREGMKQYEKERRKPKPIDEDLYKIPPELLYQPPKKKKLLWNLWAGCLGLNCIA